ncbi:MULTISPECIES: primosomal protein N' [Peptoniphilus]|uniref:primosomal protein N' n=2 Tax=Peptoniphilaceae TaxID=1570339 RepID=UPI0025837195|nr:MULTISPECIES: primosomal protein N' [Peptoniphilus]MBS6610219.1 primosomal protein N' [Peptoniphilus harei]MDU1043289.1 primosomal protein N' [Peptoniphilus rhinitidis]MDU1954006.1 primosomal protein N' [Peptoniphilus lacydonensis]MDU2115244.1 primosomal protein N' [Peptoniphilus lacydonensis]MDU5275159.1 primosomal protein N' [Peptoniphilus lacydonensis]
MFADIFIENNFQKIDKLYTYIVKDDVKEGMRVLVSFGNSYRVGIILFLYKDYSGEHEKSLKEVDSVLDDEPIISKDLIELGLWMKNRYLIGYSKAFSPILPPGNLQKIKKKIIIEDYPTGEDLILLNSIDLNKYYEDLNIDQKKIVKKLHSKGFLKYEYDSLVLVKPKRENFLKISENFSSKFLEDISEKQRTVFNFIKDKKEVSRIEVMTSLSISYSPIKTLIKKGIITEFKKEIKREPDENNFSSENISLNEEQQRALKSIEKTEKVVTLLHGLTGSGKTEVYLNIASRVIENGGEVIVLVPEIGLTPQMIERFKGRFGKNVAIIHSKLSSGERYDEYRKVLNGDVKVVVGVRSAVFVPFKNLKMIIVDESHDSSYEFHDNLKYDTIEVAIHRMKGKGKVLLGSATPSIESYFYAKKGYYNLCELKNRAKKGAFLPNTKIVDMRDELLMGNISIFSRELRDAIKDKLEKKEQIILFLNRRGFSNFISCRSCGEVIKCDNCDISMTYHKSKNRLICHYCGSTKEVPKVCPNCGSKFIKQFGIGTQKVEEEVNKLFPEARVVRMDRDTTTKKDSFKNFYDIVKNREADIIIGTQMVSKGFDFENVTLVGIVAADLSLYISDYKAKEKTFQLVTQVAGRAGRSSKKGEVIIQTYSPDSEIIKYSANGDYKDFYEYEISERKLFLYPPYMKLIEFEFSSYEEKLTYIWAERFLKQMKSDIKNIDLMVTNFIKLPKIKKINRTKFSVKVKPKDMNLLIEVLKRVIINSKINDDSKIFLNIEF